MRNLIILLLTCSFCNISIGQTNGYFDKKFILESNFMIYNPCLYNVSSYMDGSRNYKADGTSYKIANNRLDYGYRLDFGFNKKRNSAIHLEIGHEFFSFNPNYKYYSVYDGQNSYFAEEVKVLSFSFMPKIEFTSPDGLLPVGLYNQVGIGANYYKPIQKEYYLIETGAYPEVKKTSELFNPEFKSKSLSLLYKVGMRIPINKSMLFNFGFRYMFTWNIDKYILGNSSFDSDYILSNYDMHAMINAKETRKIMLFETGLTIAF
jgi:hypothetical protein